MRVIARLNMGGPAHHVGLLSGRRLEELGYQTLLAHGTLPPGEKSLDEIARREGADMRFIAELVQPVSPVSDTRALARLVKLMRDFRPQIVHTHTAKAGFLGRLAALSLRPRPLIVHTYHGHVLRGYFGPAKTGLYRRLERSAGRLSDCLIGTSQATVDELVELGVAPRERFRVVPLGLDLDPFSSLDPTPDAEARAELGVGDGEVLFTFVGRVVPIKRLDLMLRALAAARRRGAPAKLAIVGDGEIRPELERLAHQLGVAEAVRFLGYRRDLARIAAATDVALLSSDNEGTPVSLIEAAAAARPGVATSVGGVAEVLKPDSGVLVAAGDHEGMAVAIELLSSDPDLRAQMGSRARDHALSRFSAARLVADIDSLYGELLARRA